MDKEIRARVSMLGNYVASKYDLDDLRAKKQEILDVVRNGVPEIKDAEGDVVQERLEGTVEHFAHRGVTITNLGHFGGFEYEESEIQTAINQTFIAQQEKVKTEAAFEAQGKVNERIELEAEALANKARTIAAGQADAVKISAEAEANAIAAVARATREAGKDPLFIQIKQLEVETQRITKWNGQYPGTLMSMGTGDTPNLLLNVPIGATSPQ
jgi:regulator of protease activity HflC (stomatin/prohibitin superfamily)